MQSMPRSCGGGGGGQVPWVLTQGGPPILRPPVPWRRPGGRGGDPGTRAGAPGVAPLRAARARRLAPDGTPTAAAGCRPGGGAAAGAAGVSGPGSPPPTWRISTSFPFLPASLVTTATGLPPDARHETAREGSAPRDRATRRSKGRAGASRREHEVEVLATATGARPGWKRDDCRVRWDEHPTMDRIVTVLPAMTTAGGSSDGVKVGTLGAEASSDCASAVPDQCLHTLYQSSRRDGHGFQAASPLSRPRG